MVKKNSTSVLASYATLKSLVDGKKYQSAYQIFREFIRSIIVIDSLRTFSTLEMKNRLNGYFGFSIPEAVIKTSVKKKKEVSLFCGIYSISFSEIDNYYLFETKRKEADEDKLYIIQLRSEYIASRIGDEVIDKEKLINGLVYFLTENQSAYLNNYIDLIGAFALKNKKVCIPIFFRILVCIPPICSKIVFGNMIWNDDLITAILSQ